MNKNLEGLRLEIDEIDKNIALLLAKRFLLIKDVAQIKKENNLPTLDSKREELIFNNNCSYIPTEYIPYYKMILKTILDNSKIIIENDRKSE